MQCPMPNAGAGLGFGPGLGLWRLLGELDYLRQVASGGRLLRVRVKVRVGVRVRGRVGVRVRVTVGCEVSPCYIWLQLGLGSSSRPNPNPKPHPNPHPNAKVSHCYICLDEYPTLAERRAVLRQQHGFTCVCQRCAEEALQEAGPASAASGRRKA